MKPVMNEGSDVVKAVVQGLIGGGRGDLKECKIAIIESSRMAEATPVKTMSSGPVAAAMGFSLTMVYSGPVFDVIKGDRAEALIANSLADWRGEKNVSRDGMPDYYTYKRNAALKIHPEVFVKYHDILPDHAEMVAAVNQLELDFGENGSTVRRRAKKGGSGVVVAI